MDALCIGSAQVMPGLALAQHTSATLAGTQLTLRDADNNMQLVLAQEQSNTPKGTAWRVDSVNNGRQAVASLVLRSQLTLVLGDDGIATGDTGCNRYRRLYTSAETSLNLGPLMTIRRACTSADLARQEQAFLAAPGASSTYEVSGGELTVRDVNGDTEFTAAAASVQPVPGGPVP